MKVTYELIEQGKSKNGGWSGKQLAEFGIKFPLSHGWLKDLIGKEFPEENVKRFLELKDKHITPKLERKLKRKTEKRRERAAQNKGYAVADFFRATEGL